ncbi:MAG: Ig-like domain-containing protein [Betaproteobacteria bacterium]
MSTTYTWEFGAAGSGLHFSITYDTELNTFTVTSSEGSFDLNALWFSDGGTSDGYTLTKSDSSLNMNGSNTVWDDGTATSEKIAWDDYLKLSSTGLGSLGTEKNTFISDGETKTFTSAEFLGGDFVPADITADTTLGVRATSVNGNDSIKWADTEAVVNSGDTTAPDAPVVDLDAGSDSGSSDADNITNDDTPTLTITAEAGSAVEVFRDGVSVGLATETGTPGTFTFTSADLADADYDFTATATDTAGNTSVLSAALEVTIDTTAPDAPVVDLDAGSDTGVDDVNNVTQDDTPTVRVTLNGTGLTAPVVGDVVNVYSGLALVGTKTLTALDISNDYADVTTSDLGPEGTYSLSATIADVAGNESAASNSVTLTVDQTAPTDLDITFVGDPGVVTTGGPFTIGRFVGTDNTTVNPDFTFQITGVQTAALTSTVFAPLSPHPFSVDSSDQLITSALAENTNYAITVEVSDLAGNIRTEVINIVVGNSGTNDAADPVTDPTGSPNNGDDVLFGLAGGDTHIFGFAGDDMLFGGEGGDVLHGGDDNDTLIGGGGNDTLNGEAGNDILVFDQINNHIYNGGTGTDTLEVRGAMGNIEGIDARFESIEIIDLGVGVATASVGNADGGPSGPNRLDVQDVLDITDQTGIVNLFIEGDSADTVYIHTGAGQFSTPETVFEDTYALYTATSGADTVNLYIALDITRNEGGT